jgi:hypothetical protein
MAKVPGQRKTGQSGGADHIANVFTYKRARGKSGSGSNGCLVTAIALGAGLAALIGGSGYGLFEAFTHLS